MTRFEALAAIRARKPLLHCISNLVTANDCANLALAVGASPIMAQAPQEMADIAVLASAVVLNTGTPDEAKFTAARLAGAAANRCGIPVVLDPVGVGASPWRLENIRQLLQEVHPAILRANYGEAAALLGLSAAEHGVDSLTVPIDAAACAQALAQKLGTVVVLSGAEDLVTDGTALHTVSGGSDLMRRVTGAGCMLTVLCGALPLCSRKPPYRPPYRPPNFGKPVPPQQNPRPTARPVSGSPCWMLLHKSYNFILQVIVNHKKEEAEPELHPIC